MNVFDIIPADAVTGVMKEAGNLMDPGLKETAGAGLAATSAELKLKELVFGK